MQPKLSYTIWFTQRTGSTLLCKTLEKTQIAGLPQEWLHAWWDQQHGKDPAELQKCLWKNGITSNGVFGQKHSWSEPHFTHLIETFRRFLTCPANEKNRVRIWEHALPNHKHVFMTRRNKVRLAVSCWKALKTQEWHRLAGESSRSVDLSDAYRLPFFGAHRRCGFRRMGRTVPRRTSGRLAKPRLVARGA